MQSNEAKEDPGASFVGSVASGKLPVVLYSARSLLESSFPKKKGSLVEPGDQTGSLTPEIAAVDTESANVDTVLDAEAPSAEEESFLSFRPNYQKGKSAGGESALNNVGGGGAVFTRRTYERDLVMRLRNSHAVTLPATFLDHLSSEEQLLVLQGEEADSVVSPPLSPLVVKRSSPGEPSSNVFESLKVSENGDSTAQPMLKPGKGAWIAPSAIGNLGMTSESKIVGAAKGIFNKLTRQTFQKLSTELVELLNKHPEQLEEFVNIIFETACLEPAFCALYAKLCVKLSLDYFDSSEPLADEETTRRKVLRVLLEKVKAEFESNAQADKERENERLRKATKEREKSLAVIEGGFVEEKEDGNVPDGLRPLQMSARERETELESKFRDKKLGNMTFIGELFRLRLVPEKTIHGCIIYLLRNVKNPADEDVEHLCRLLTIAGKEVDTPRAQSYVNQYFQRIAQLIRQPTLPIRLRFMLQDLVELRKSEWSIVQLVSNRRLIEAHRRKHQKLCFYRALTWREQNKKCDL